MDETTFTVGEISAAVGETLAQWFPDEMWVRGEIRNLTRANSGHVYFDLVDRSLGDTLAVTLFSSNRAAVNATLKQSGGVRMSDGTEVRIKARLSWYGARSRVQLNMSGIDPAFTLGRLAAARDELLRKLAAEHLVDANRRRPVPAMPLRIGLVTSAESAAYHDFIAELTQAGQHWQVLLVDTRVQGPGAEHDIAAALRAADQAGVDLIALVRGGGARTDLAPFDAEVVARTIAACAVPVVAGIGHEIDRSVADEVVARSLKTPTACAQHLTELVAVAIDSAHGRWKRITDAVDTRLDRCEERLRRDTGQLNHRAHAALHQAETSIDAQRLARVSAAHLDRATAGLGPRWQRATSAAGRAARHAEVRLAAAESIAAANDPGRALRRGWSITYGPDGQVIREAQHLAVGDALRTRLATGVVGSEVTEIEGSPP